MFPADPAKKIRTMCVHCGIYFEHYACSPRTFCSRWCFNDRPSRRIKACPVCTRTFLAPSVNVKKYCCRECYYKSKRKSLRKNERKFLRWTSLTRRIRRRDSWSCVACGALNRTGRLFSVDHIIPYVTVKRTTIGPDHPDNLMTLCQSCHNRKTLAEQLFFHTGKLAIFWDEMLRLNIPQRRLRIAFELYNILGISANA
jgi:5-methylcytosine-specific restriction endonuclease McrA